MPSDPFTNYHRQRRDGTHMPLAYGELAELRRPRRPLTLWRFAVSALAFVGFLAILALALTYMPEHLR